MQQFPLAVESLQVDATSGAKGGVDAVVQLAQLLAHEVAEFRVQRAESEAMWNRIQADGRIGLRWPGMDESDFGHVSIAGGAYIRALTGAPLAGIEVLKQD